MPKKPQLLSCEASFVFLDCLVILNKDSILLMVRKKDFAEIQNNFLTAGHSVFLGSFSSAGHMATFSCSQT